MKKLMCVAAAMAAFLWWGRPAQADPPNRSVDATAAADLVARVNDQRAGIGLPALTVDAELAAKATAWAATMADAGRIWHSVLSDGVTADWARLGENVGMASSVDALHRAFVESPRHYENLASPDFQSVGIGVARVDGMLYGAEVFMRRQPVRTPLPTPAEPVMTTGTAPAGPTAAVSRPTPAPRPAAKTPTTRPAAARPALEATPSAPAVPQPAPPSPSVLHPQPIPAASSNTSPPEMQLAASHTTVAAGPTWVIAAGMAAFVWAAVTAALAVVVRPGRRPTRRGRPLTYRELRRLVGPIPAGRN